MRLFEKTFSVKVADFNSLRQSMYDELSNYWLLYGRVDLKLTLGKDDTVVTIYVDDEHESETSKE